MDVAARAGRATREADQSDWMDYAVRIGLVSYGVVHLVLAWLAIQLALGSPEGSASSQGAFQQMAETTPGQISLYVVAFGFLALVVWQALEAGWGHRDEDGGKRVFKRVTSAGKAVLYAVLGVGAFKVATGSSAGGGGTDGPTAQVMSLPAGQLIVGAVGLGIIAVAGFLIYRGWTEKFRSKLEAEGQTGADGSAYILFGKLGYIFKGIALALVGLLFVFAAVTHDPNKSAGLDQALRALQQQPFGAPVLFGIALGFACYGLFCFAWARHLDR
jgi:Domain of Unknown Function (DUF1206)